MTPTAYRYRLQVCDKFTYLDDAFEIGLLVNALLDSSRQGGGSFVKDRFAGPVSLEVDRQDINLRGKVNDEAEVLKRAFSFAELAAMESRMRAARNGKVIEAPAAPATDPDSGNQAEPSSSGSSWRD